MKAEWTIAGPATVTLGDDSVKHGIELEQLGLAALVQQEPAYGSATQFLTGRGNAAGECVFTAVKSHASMDAAAQFAAGELGRVGQSGSLKFTLNTHFATMANAVLKSVARVESDEAKGKCWKLRYVFGIVTVAYS